MLTLGELVEPGGRTPKALVRSGVLDSKPVTLVAHSAVDPENVKMAMRHQNDRAFV